MGGMPNGRASSSFFDDQGNQVTYYDDEDERREAEAKADKEKAKEWHDSGYEELYEG